MKKGFTLIELLTVVVIMSLVTIGAGSMLVTYLRGASRSEVRNKVKGEGNYVLGLVERKIREAESVDTADCLSGSVATIDLDGETLDPTALVSDNVVIEMVSFSCNESGGVMTVDYSFRVSQTANEERQLETRVSESFSGSVTLRNSYR